MSKAFIDFLESIVAAENILLEEPMHKHTTFRVGGPAEVFVTVENKEQLEKIIKYLNLVERPYFILGNGSNLLVGDKGYRGVIIRLGGEFNTLKTEGTLLTAGASVLLSAAARAAMENGLTGMEFASGIPGSIGGGVKMNAGAYDGEMRQIVESVQVMYKDGSILDLDNETMEFGYRNSVIKNRPYVVLQVSLRLQPGNREEILARMNELAARRKEKQPLEFASAGSTFKRPEGYFAGKFLLVNHKSFKKSFSHSIPPKYHPSASARCMDSHINFLQRLDIFRFPGQGCQNSKAWPYGRSFPHSPHYGYPQQKHRPSWQ